MSVRAVFTKCLYLFQQLHAVSIRAFSFHCKVKDIAKVVKLVTSVIFMRLILSLVSGTEPSVQTRNLTYGADGQSKARWLGFSRQQ